MSIDEIGDNVSSHPKLVAKTFKIETSPEVMGRIERFLALLHHNSNFGHSGLFAIPLDCDGWDKVRVEPIPDHAGEVEAIGGVGYDVEFVCDTGYTGRFFDTKRKSKWRTAQRSVLLEDGEVKRTMSR